MADEVTLEDFKKWKNNVLKCPLCRQIVPKTNLFICRSHECKYRLTQKKTIINPDQFLRTEPVCCAVCAFKGYHASHAENMVSAAKLAIYIASGEFESEYSEEIDDVLTLNHENLLDFTIANNIKADSLPPLDVGKYLKSSETIGEWNERRDKLSTLVEKLRHYREEAKRVVDELANDWMETFNEIMGSNDGNKNDTINNTLLDESDESSISQNDLESDDELETTGHPLDEYFNIYRGSEYPSSANSSFHGKNFKVFDMNCDESIISGNTPSMRNLGISESSEDELAGNEW